MTLFSHVAAGLAALAAVVSLSRAADPAPAAKRLLLVTHSGGFIHDSLGTAEDVLAAIGPKNGFAVTTYRFTGDPSDAKAFAKYGDDFRKRTGKTVEPENCGRINKDTLKNFDAVLFYTTGSRKPGQIAPLTEEEVGDLIDWVKAGGAFTACHSGSDTLYTSPRYGELVGGYFVNHPWTQKVKLVDEDPNHPAALGFRSGAEIDDEIYQFVAPYSRDKLHVILKIDNNSIDADKKDKDGKSQIKRDDKDFAVAWCQEVGKGKSFYTSLGHRKEVWNDPRFQEHLIGGLRWATNQFPGDATPSAKLKK